MNTDSILNNDEQSIKLNNDTAQANLQKIHAVREFVHAYFCVIREVNRALADASARYNHAVKNREQNYPTSPGADYANNQSGPLSRVTEFSGQSGLTSSFTQTLSAIIPQYIEPAPVSVHHEIEFEALKADADACKKMQEVANELSEDMQTFYRKHIKPLITE